MFAAATSPPRFLTLVMLTGLSVLSLNMFLPSLANIAGDLGADYSLVSLSIAGYLGVTAFLQLIMGPLSDRFGRRPVLLVGLAIFTLASVACTLVENIWMFLGFRVLQGAIISGYVISLAVVRDTLPENEAASRIGYVSMAMAVAPMVGPMIGGVLDQVFGWRANFVAYSAMGAIVFGLCWLDLGETNTSPSETFMKQMRAYPDLLRARRFWGYALCMAFSTGAFYSFLAGAPLVAKTLFDMSPAALGFAMGTITGGFVLGSFLSGRYASRFSQTTMMIAGRVVACAGLSAGLLLYSTGIVHVLSIFGATIFVGIGNGLTMPSSNAGALSVKPHLVGSAAGLSGALTVAGAAVLATLTGAIIDEENAAAALLAMMLLSSILALGAALYVRNDLRNRPETGDGTTDQTA